MNYCQEHQEKFILLKNPYIARNSNKNYENWSRITTPIVSDSMLHDIEERRILKRDTFLETFDGMHDNINVLIHLKNQYVSTTV